MIINGLLLYLSNCVSLLASPCSIAWQGSSSQHLLSFGCFLPGHSNKLLSSTLQQVSSSPPACQRLPLFLSCQTQGSRYCSVIHLCWTLTLVLWLCTLSDPVFPFSSSFSSASLPLTLLLAASLSFAEFVTSEFTQKQLVVDTYVAFDMIWISEISGSTAWWGLKCWRPFLRDKLHHLHLLWM